MNVLLLKILPTWLWPDKDLRGLAEIHLWYVVSIVDIQHWYVVDICLWYAASIADIQHWYAADIHLWYAASIADIQHWYAADIRLWYAASIADIHHWYASLAWCLFIIDMILYFFTLNLHIKICWREGSNSSYIGWRGEEERLEIVTCLHALTITQLHNLVQT